MSILKIFGNHIFPLATFLIIGHWSCSDGPSHASIRIEINDAGVKPEIQYGISRLTEDTPDGFGLIESHAGLTITGSLDSINYHAEAFEILADGKEITINAGDAKGMMYALLDLKEQIDQGKIIEPRRESPEVSFRAIKFNLPWMSYRQGEALDLHQETCRDITFWGDFLDMMAENRFNVLTLWSLHPFHLMVRTAKYPEACTLTDPELAEWQQFWSDLFRMAKERGIETYLINWNIFVSPAFAQAHDVATYSIDKAYIVDQGDTSELVKDYTRATVKAVIDAYPDLTGLGITLGEGMGGMTAEAREQWLLESFIAGARMASRKIKFIHRAPLSAGTGSGGSTSTQVEQLTRRTLDTLSCFIKPIITELKFNWSHGHSSPHLIKVHGGKLTDAYWNPPPESYRLAWTIRNEDFFILRWGQPDFVRQHIRQNTPNYVIGYLVGSECYIPAKDYITKLDGVDTRYAFQRQWMFYKTWGRLLFNPDLADSYFADAFYQRFPDHGQSLFDAQRAASKVPLVIASYWNARWDYTLYAEGMLTLDNDRGMRLISLEGLTKIQPLEPTYMSVSEFVENGGRSKPGKISPLALADSLGIIAKQVFLNTDSIDYDSSVDLRYEVSDSRAWAHIGLYFAHKLRAAVAYAQYQRTNEIKYREEAVKWLETGITAWDQLVTLTKDIYDPVPLMHYTRLDSSRYFHWEHLKKEVEDELIWLQAIK